MKRFLQIIFPVAAILLLVYVWSVAIQNNGGFPATFQSAGQVEVIYNFVRLAGLSAFVLLGLQVATGPWMKFWEHLYGQNFYRYHGYQGIFTLLFALSHWMLLHVYIWMSNLSLAQFKVGYPLPEFLPFYFGPVALFLMVLTVVTALLAVFFHWSRMQRAWHVIHYLNYLIFLLVYFHSRAIGTDVSPPDSPLRIVWNVFFVVTVLGFAYRRIYRPWADRRMPQPGSASESAFINHTH